MTRQPSAASALALCAATSAGTRTILRVMSLNIRGGGAHEAKGIAQAADDHPGRIDFVWARRAGPRVTDAAIVGEDGPRSDIMVMPWPSDHRAVVAAARV